MLFLYLLNIVLFLFAPQDEQKIIDAVNKKLADYDSVVITHIQMPKNYNEININDNIEIKRSGNYCYVPVIITVNGSKANSYVQVEFAVYKRVLTAKAIIKKDEIINYNNTETVLSNVTFARGNTLSVIDTVQKIKSKIQINYGDILFDELLTKVPIVLKGNSVVLNNIKGNVIVSIDGNAKQDGAVGDIITVQTVDKKLFKGKVLDSINILKVE